MTSLPSGVRAQLDALVTDARRKVGERVRSPLERSLEELQRSLAPAPPAAVGAAPLRPPRPPPAPRRVRGVRLQLPDGRTLAAAPPLARSDDLAALARTCAANDRAAHRVLVAHEEALARLQAAVEELRAVQREAERRAELALVGLLERLSGLGRAAKVGRRSPAAAGAARAARERRAVAAAVRRQAVEARVQRLNAVVQSAQTAAYGRRGSVLDRRNLVLAGNQLLWSFVDPLLRTLGVWAGPKVSPLAQLAPLGSLITGAAALERPSFKGGSVG